MGGNELLGGGLRSPSAFLVFGLVSLFVTTLAAKLLVEFIPS